MTQPEPESREPRAKSATPRATALALLLVAATTAAVGAQVNPTRDWQTLRTEHFRVHFTPELEGAARRAATLAESAWVKLSLHLTPPRGTVELVIADNVDYANGSATMYPWNRIVIYAYPPTGDDALRFVDDPLDLVITHELVHVFQLDRSTGIWRFLQRFLGRDPNLFPHASQPSWLVEGLAVYYESLITGSGRLAGSHHHMIGRTAGQARAFPRIDQLSLASPHFPYGYGAYAYGSLFVDHLARTHGDTTMRRFVEAASRGWIPLWLNRPARKAFGASFTAAYTRWRDSLQRAPVPSGPAIPGWRDLTVHGAYANAPRWLDDSTVVYVGTDGRTTFGAYSLRLRAALDSVPGSRVPGPDAVVRTRLARRHTRSPNTRLPDGSLVYAELEFVNPFDVRSDLYVDRARGGRRRLTHGARLSAPDARASDGLIVAEQAAPAAIGLALVSPDGRTITPITAGGLDEQWVQPRWSPDGARIAAVRWSRGGAFELVVLDSAGRVLRSIARERAVIADPSWSRDGRWVYFSSDRTGIMNLYRAGADEGGSPSIVRLSDTQSGLFEPQLSPDARSLLAVAYRADGYHLGIAPVDSAAVVPADDRPGLAPRGSAPVTDHGSPVTPYRPWHSLRPRWWQPLFEPALDSSSLRIGAFTSGFDLVDRHAYSLLLYVPTDNSGITGAAAWRYAGLGQPIVDLAASQERTNFRCIADASQQNVCVGYLRRRIRDASIATTLNRIRQRSASYVSLGAGVELRDYGTDPDTLIDRVDSLYRHTLYYPRVSLSFGWNNTRYPQRAISPEDGIAFASTTRFRWRRESPALSTTARAAADSVDAIRYSFSTVASLAAYKSVPLPGFANHVLAVRAAGGWTDSRSSGYLEIGGVSGGTIELFPGYVLGEGRRTFPIRGFPAGAMVGMRAYTVTAEYRAPLWLPGRGIGLWPAFLDRTSLTLFGDLGSAWCPQVFPTRPAPAFSLCTQGDYDIGRTAAAPASHPALYLAAYNIGSVGGELTASLAAWGWDQPFRYRLGYARPVVGRALLAGVSAATAYLTVGLAF